MEPTTPAVDPFHAKGLKFQCTGCGNCCTGGPGFVWVSEVEMARLVDYLKLPVEQVLRKYCRRISGQISLKEKRPNSLGQYDCIFLKHQPADPGDGQTVVHCKRICSIYPVRPLQCRTWPFWEGNLASPNAWLHAGKRCPGIDTGKRHTRGHIESRRDARDWPKE